VPIAFAAAKKAAAVFVPEVGALIELQESVGTWRIKNKKIQHTQPFRDHSVSTPCKRTRSLSQELTTVKKVTVTEMLAYAVDHL